MPLSFAAGKKHDARAILVRLRPSGESGCADRHRERRPRGYSVKEGAAVCLGSMDAGR
jgi:hypothetical protein